LSFSLFFSGCAEDLVVEDFGKIEEGMTQDEVVRLLGEGTEVAAADVESLMGKFDGAELSEDACDTWLKWGNRKATGYVGFKDGKVQETMLD
jgi:hypothetical protein